MNSIRRIAHLDMDAFFASVELLHYPELRDQAVVVGGSRIHQPTRQDDGTVLFSLLENYTGRGVVTTSTYPARKLGVFSGMGLMQSARLAPKAILLPANFDAYRHYSRLFKTAVGKLTPHIENRGIDEIYIDLSLLPEDSTTLALQIKTAVREATGLNCSIGIAPNKLLAKIASDLDKPNGLTLITPENIAERIWPLSVRKINGIGPKSGEKLGQMQIHTIGELANTPVNKLVEAFGATTGNWLHQAAQGIDNRPVITESEPRSISKETTFERDLHIRENRQELGGYFTRLCREVGQNLEKKCCFARTIGVKIRYADFQTITRDITLLVPTRDLPEIRKAAGMCLKRIAMTQKIRLLGIRASNLIPENESTPSFPIQQELPF